MSKPKAPAKKQPKTIKFKRPVPVQRAGNQKEAALARRMAFAYAYIANGKNGTEAAKTAGFSPKTAGSKANQLLKLVDVQQIIADATAKAAGIAGLSVERTLRELARIAYSDVRKLYDEDGNLIPVQNLDDDVAATVSSIEHVEEFSGKGNERELVGYTKKLKVWDKKGALDMAMKFHGLYEKDNEQLKGDSLPLMVAFGK